MTIAAWGFMGVIWCTIIITVGVSMSKIIKDQKS